MSNAERAFNFGWVGRYDVEATRRQLAQSPQLWNANHGRTGKDSPHHGTSDIWVRFCPESLMETYGGGPHSPAFYPAWHSLPALHSLVFDVMRDLEATMLGGVLITRIPPGGQVKPHHDRGGWHAEFYNTKAYVALQGNERCVNYCEGDQIELLTGDCVTFDNLLTHSVVNGGDEDRITLIICMRVD